MDLNRIHMTGRLGAEPLLYDVGDHPVAALYLVSTRSWRGADGARRAETTWYNLTAWEELAEQCGRQLHRDDRVYVEGHLHLWNEHRGAHWVLCHTVILDHIELLAIGAAPCEHTATAFAERCGRRKDA
jgi:single stranded DNA-binding protein